jgi:hypothetical protein
VDESPDGWFIEVIDLENNAMCGFSGLTTEYSVIWALAWNDGYDRYLFDVLHVPDA